MELWPLGAKTAHAAASPGSTNISADIIDAPFIYRSGLVKEGAKPSPSEARIPVYIVVPPGTGFDPARREQPVQVAPELSPAVPQPSRPASPQSGLTRPETGSPAAPQPGLTRPEAGAVSGPSGSVTQRITPLPGSAAPAAQPEVPAGRAGPQAAEQTVVYVDETGKPVDPPLDPRTALADIENMMLENNFQGAYELAEKLLKQSNLSREQRENILHRRADSVFSLHRNEPENFFKEITDTTTEAISFNTGSLRNAGAWLRLGYLNLKANNAYEAEAYFSLLRQQFPKDDNIPLSYYYMGDYQYEQGNLNDAVLQFRFVVEEFPDSRYSRDAALGLTRTLYRLGYYDKAYEIIDYVEKRWPRFYLDYPLVLSLIGDTAYRARQVDRARQAYWLYYNLQPNAADADIILSRLGDIYQSQKYRNAARHVYEEAAKRFPSKDGGIIAMMRMVENGINDDPSLAGMFKVFKQPYNLAPAETYRKIIRDFPDNPLAMLAKLKLAMWSLWQKDYDACFSLCNEIVMAAPDDPLAARALEVSRNAFSMLAAESVNTKRYVRVLDFWNRYPLLHTQEEFLDPESRLALAVSQWEGSNPDVALDTLEPFFLGGKIPEYSEMALILGLTIQVEYNRWAEVEDLLNRVEMWEITPETRRQMDYALGLAYENQGKSQSALPIWKNLYEQNSLPPEQQDYADYFLARQAEKDKDYETAYRIGQEALRRLKDLAALNPGQADTEKIKNILGSLMGIAQASGLIQDALDYGAEYLQYSDQGSDDALSIMYNMAALHRRRGSMGEWEKILTELSANYPQTYYGKAAATQLSSYSMDREAAKYAPAGNL
jgi:TolA-binding protein